MDTKNLNVNPAEGSEDKSAKAGKAKKMAGKAAGFAAAAGVGVAGTLGAEALADDSDISLEDITVDGELLAEEMTDEDAQAESTTDFDPNDIRIEAEDVKAEPVEVAGDVSDDIAIVVEPEPISGEYIVDADDVMIAEIEPETAPNLEMGPDITENTDDLEDIYNDEDLIVDTDGMTDDMTDDIDIADDLMA